MCESEPLRRLNEGINELATDPPIADDVRRYEAEQRHADRLAAIEATSATPTNAFPSGYLDDLRDDWTTAVKHAAQVTAQRSAELNRRLSWE